MPNGGGDEVRLRMSGRVLVGVHRVGRGENHLAIQHEKRAEWMVALPPGVAGESDSLSDELLVRIHRRHHISTDRRGVGSSDATIYFGSSYKPNATPAGSANA